MSDRATPGAAALIFCLLRKVMSSDCNITSRSTRPPKKGCLSWQANSRRRVSSGVRRTCCRFINRTHMWRSRDT
jgi:hypothetical protein